MSMPEALLLYAQFLKEFPLAPCEENPVLALTLHYEYPVQFSLVLNTGSATYDVGISSRFRYWFAKRGLDLRSYFVSRVNAPALRMVRAKNFNGFWTRAVPVGLEETQFLEEVLF